MGWRGMLGRLLWGLWDDWDFNLVHVKIFSKLFIQVY